MGKKWPKRSQRRGGFTLIELMIVLVLAGIVLAIGAPSFGDFQRNNRLTAVANDFITAAQQARNEAVKRQTSVSLCASGNPNSANPSCTAGAFTGWIVFVDADSNCARGNGEAVVKADGPLDTSLGSNANGRCLSFSASGFSQTIAGQPPLGRLLFCDERGLAMQTGTTLSAARGVSIARTGRTLVQRDPAILESWGLACQVN